MKNTKSSRHKFGDLFKTYTVFDTVSLWDTLDYDCKILCEIPNDEIVLWLGRGNDHRGVEFQLVLYDGFVGFISSTSYKTLYDIYI